MASNSGFKARIEINESSDRGRRGESFNNSFSLNAPTVKELAEVAQKHVELVALQEVGSCTVTLRVEDLGATRDDIDYGRNIVVDFTLRGVPAEQIVNQLQGHLGVLSA